MRGTLTRWRSGVRVPTSLPFLHFFQSLADAACGEHRVCVAVCAISSRFAGRIALSARHDLKIQKWAWWLAKVPAATSHRNHNGEEAPLIDAHVLERSSEQPAPIENRKYDDGYRRTNDQTAYASHLLLDTSPGFSRRVRNQAARNGAREIQTSQIAGTRPVRLHFCQSWKEAAERTGMMRISCSGLRNSM
jgi:hypothetical protein